MTIQAIETRYAGCRFRSRLEARWAVFFDRMSIPWEYEPQGFMVGPDGDKQPYLPDFWLPGERLWVEVKGSIPDLRKRLLMTHAVVTHPGWGLPDNERGLLALGGIPDLRAKGTDAWHHRFEFYKGDLYRTPFSWSDDTPYWPREWNIACGVDGGVFDVSPWCSWLDGGGNSAWNPSAYIRDDVYVAKNVAREAYVTARSARFEHGESP